jgi:hypothetical protein
VVLNGGTQALRRLQSGKNVGRNETGEGTLNIKAHDGHGGGGGILSSQSKSPNGQVEAVRRAWTCMKAPGESMIRACICFFVSNSSHAGLWASEN